MLTDDVTVLVDVQNVYYGALNYGEGGRKIDYEKLMTVVESKVNALLDLRMNMAPFSMKIKCDFSWFGYVVQTPRYNGIGLFALLRRIGYNLRVQRYPSDLPADADWRGGVASQMQMDYLEQCPNQKAMVVVSGNGALAPVFEASRRNWPNVRRILISFEHTLHSAFEDGGDIIDDIIYLEDDVLR